MNLKENDKRMLTIDFLGLLCIIPLIMTAMWPGFMALGNNAIICILCEVFWMFFAYVGRPKVLTDIFSKLWITIPYMLYVVIFPYLCGNSTIGNRYAHMSILIVGVYIFMYYKATDKLNIIGMAIKLSMPFFLFSLFKTASAGISNAYIIRQIDNNPTWYPYMIQGIGGYHFIYFLSMLSIFLFAIGINLKGFKKILILLSSVLCFFTIIVSNFMTAVAISLIGCFLVIVLHSQKKGVLFTIIFSLLIIFTYILFDTVLMKSFVGLFQTDGRIYGIFAGNDSFINAFYEEFILDRWPTMLTSINSFFAHPILGLTSGVIENNGIYDISYGQHSFILDSFALYGFPIGLLTIYNLFLPNKNIAVLRYEKSISIPIFVAYLLLATFNNLTPSTCVFYTIICPYFLEIYSLSKKKKILNNE